MGPGATADELEQVERRVLEHGDADDDLDRPQRRARPVQQQRAGAIPTAPFPATGRPSRRCRHGRIAWWAGSAPRRPGVARRGLGGTVARGSTARRRLDQYRGRLITRTTSSGTAAAVNPTAVEWPISANATVPATKASWSTSSASGGSQFQSP